MQENKAIAITNSENEMHTAQQNQECEDQEGKLCDIPFESNFTLEDLPPFWNKQQATTYGIY